MQAQMKFLAVLAVCSTSFAVAQTAVTTTGGATNMLPVFNGTSTVVQSTINQAANGSIGIGVSSPVSRLHIAGSGDQVVTVQSTTTGNPGFNFVTPKGGYTNQMNSSTAALYWWNGTNITMSLLQNGFLGVGTTAPTQPLTVNGNMASGGSGFGLIVRTPTSSQNIKVDKSLLFEGMFSGDGSIARPWGLNVMALPWSYGQDNITYHGGNHVFKAAGPNTDESEILRITPTGILFAAGGPGYITFPDGSTQASAYTAPCPKGGDYAESVDVAGERSTYEPGELLVIDPSHPGSFLKSNERYSTLVAGIYSTKPGLVGRRQPANKAKDDEVPMAMVGIVPTKVSAENGPIHTGDLLVTSSLPGHAMKGTDRSLLAGAVVGKALGTLESGSGVIEVLVSLQ